MQKILLDLRLFDGDGGDGGDGGTAGFTGDAAPEVGVEAESDTIVTTADQEQREADFNRFLKDNKDLDEKRMQRVFNDRFKDYKALQEKSETLTRMQPLFDRLSEKYGISSNDPDALLKAVEDDNTYYEDEAMEKGLTVEQLKHIKKIERENAEFKRAAEEQARRNNADRIYAQWQQDAEKTKAIYPTFDLERECSDPQTGTRYVDLLKSGIDVKTAFEVVHKDELLSGAIRYAVESTQKKTVNDIRARGLRPAENGASGNSASTVKALDPSAMTRAQREEISRRVMRGERITFNN